MNFCTKCSSYYQTPGTCNCFAPPKVTVTPFPYTPYIYPTTVPWVYPTTTQPFTIGGGSCPTTTTGIMWNGPVSIDKAAGNAPVSYGL